MKNILSTSLLAFMLCMGLSCKKKLASGDQELAGTWWNERNTTLQISSDGSGKYDYDDGSKTEYIHGKVKVSGSTITFKALSVKKSYSIDKRPYQDKNRTKMLLSGTVFVKK